ncbi:hypothetical protein CEV34_3825 [Brucella pseudogrignonensis]|uniref:Uncharacterized protein n=1 Tax=Brucella pseudogrignonensis TaxID=419475 RepID=A0A256G8U9_9HYPH|nr:hypothetical protein CEV34_3825 [Brucella pseudogrignonensis]
MTWLHKPNPSVLRPAFTLTLLPIALLTAPVRRTAPNFMGPLCRAMES